MINTTFPQQQPSVYNRFQNIMQINMVWYVSIILTCVLYLTMMTITIPRVQTYSNGQTVPDLLPLGYGTEYIFAFLTTIGPEGRTAYLFQILLDTLYPFFLALSFTIGFSRYLHSQNYTRFVHRVILLIPWLVMTFDYLENLAILHQILIFPQEATLTGMLAPYFTIIKSICSTLMFGISLIMVFDGAKLKLFKT